MWKKPYVTVIFDNLLRDSPFKLPSIRFIIKRRIILTWCQEQWQIQGKGPGDPVPPYFQTNWGPKKILLSLGPPFNTGSGWPPPSPIWRSGSATEESLTKDLLHAPLEVLASAVNCSFWSHFGDSEWNKNNNYYFYPQLYHLGLCVRETTKRVFIDKILS